MWIQSFLLVLTVCMCSQCRQKHSLCDRTEVRLVLCDCQTAVRLLLSVSVHVWCSCQLSCESSQVNGERDGHHDPTDHQERQPGLQEAHKTVNKEQRASDKHKPWAWEIKLPKESRLKEKWTMMKFSLKTALWTFVRHSPFERVPVDVCAHMRTLVINRTGHVTINTSQKSICVSLHVQTERSCVNSFTVCLTVRWDLEKKIIPHH